MLTFLKRPLYILSNKIRRRQHPGKLPEEKWIADFSKLEKFPFDIKPESSYDAYPAGNLARPPQIESGEKGRPVPNNNSLGFALKKTNHIAWLEGPKRRYEDQIIEARILLDSLGGYAAAGLLFREVDDGTYYLALVSSKGYFRLDAVKNGTPLPLVGWTETPALEERVTGGEGRSDSPLAIHLTIVAFGEALIFFVNDRWIAEINDGSASEGRIGFALAAYETPSRKNTAARVKAAAGTVAENAAHTCRAWLDYLSVDSRRKNIDELYRKWNDSALIPAESRIRLAETFAAMNAAALALAQIARVWEQREAAARSVTATYTEMRTRRELLLAARMARRLERYDEAEEYINACLEQGQDNPEGEKAAAEKTKLLTSAQKYPALKEFVSAQIARRKKDPALHALLGHACWNMKEYAPAAAAWDRAFELDRENGQYAVNAAKACILLNQNNEALSRYLEGGRIFLRQGKNEELGALVPKLLSLGGQSWDAHVLAGKWAYSAADYDRADSELALAETVRRKLRPQPPPDPAVSYLRAQMLIGRGKRREAFRFLTEAVRLAPDYGLFRLKLAETRYLIAGNARTPGLAADLKAVLGLMPDDGWARNFAARVLIARNGSKNKDLAAAEQHLQKAAEILGDIPAVKVNRGTLCYLKGSPAGALKILDADAEDDPEGLLAHCAGNLLFRSGDFEKAAAFYRRALAVAPDNAEYLSGCAACLMQLKRFDKAEELLIQARSKNPSPEILELIKRLNAKKKPVRGRPAASKPEAGTKPKAAPAAAEVTRKPAAPRKNPPKAAEPALKPAAPRKSQPKAAGAALEPAASAKSQPKAGELPRKPGRPRKNPPPA